MWKAFITLLLVTDIATHIAGQPTPNFTDEELRLFASLNLCNLYGGSCASECPFRYIRHKWQIPLCNVSPPALECCIGPAPTLTDENSNCSNCSTPSPTTSTTSTTTSSTPAPEYATCGTLSSSSSRRKRIVGGQIASPGRWPWLAALRSMLGSHACSGAVIAQRWVVTAAHCFKYVSNPSLWRLRIGEHDLLHRDEGERDLRIQEIILHPGYRFRQQQQANNLTLYARYVHDIALIRLAEDARTEPICLPTGGVDILNQSELSNEINNTPTVTNELSGLSNSVPRGNSTAIWTRAAEAGREQDGRCWVAGWGVTMNVSIVDQVLREVSGSVMNSTLCSQRWGTRLEDDMVCFGDGTYGPCAGDSGSPLACARDGRFYLTGVVSWGTENCTQGGYPSVFTRTRSFIPWIEEQMGRDK